MKMDKREAHKFSSLAFKGDTRLLLHTAYQCMALMAECMCRCLFHKPSTLNWDHDLKEFRVSILTVHNFSTSTTFNPWAFSLCRLMGINNAHNNNSNMHHLCLAQVSKS